MANACTLKRAAAGFGAALALLALSSCGGGAPGSNPTPSPSPTGGVQTIATLEISSSKNSLLARAGETADITVTALDASRRAVASASVLVTADSGILTVPSSVTDASGKLSATFDLGQNRANRTVTITATGGGAAAVSSIVVTGVQLSATANPSQVTGSTQTSVITVRALDAAQQPLAGVSIAFATSQGALSATSAVTDASGTATVNLSGVTTTADVTASLPNTTAVTATVTSSGSGSATPQPAGVVIRDFFVQVNPAVISTNDAGSLTNFATVQVAVQGSVGATSGVSVQNAPVRFRIASNPPLGSLEINTTTTPALTSAAGSVSNRFFAGAAASGTDGVVICASVDGVTPATPGVAGTPCTATEKAALLTVAQQALFVKISTNNEISKVDQNLNYEKLFSVYVTDAAGRGVAGIQVTPRLLPLSYEKGYYVFDTVANEWAQVVTALCTNEDLNFNGILDPAPTDNNVNNDDKVWPGQAAAVSIDNNGVTDSTGFVIMRVKYGQRFATWASYDASARASVGGSEGTASMNYGLNAAASDIESPAAPGFIVSPFGIANTCSDPN